MSVRVLTGTKAEIAATVAQLAGEVREAIVFIDEPAPTVDVDIFAEMEPYVAKAGGADYSREGIYFST